MTSRFARLALAGVVVLGLVGSAGAVELQNLIRIKGSEASTLTGMGLVVGLNGTGDGNKSVSTMRVLANLMNNLGEEMVTPGELRDAENVAVVFMSVRVPSTGVREGDELDIDISAPTAESLEGGRLILSPLVGPVRGAPIYAFGNGPVLVPDPANPLRAVIRKGATMVQDNYARTMDDLGQITLVVRDEYASWPMANKVALMINDQMAPDAPPICFALDQKNVVIQVPQAERANPAGFISRLLEMSLDQTLIQTEARVVVSRGTGTIVFTGDVEVSPVVVMHNGLTVTTVSPTPPPTLERPEVLERTAIAIDPAGRGGASLDNLITAFDQLKVPVNDRIAILEKIKRAGKLHANLIYQD